MKRSPHAATYGQRADDMTADLFDRTTVSGLVVPNRIAMLR
ncbi:hypothetical protein ACH40E_41435 [Streptomyces acidicola]